MQIDFHHAVTYVIARLAGFNHSKASKVAYCSQYVDDATNSGVIRFNYPGSKKDTHRVGPMFQRTSSAHKHLDYRNNKALANHKVWVPFHFLPGNGGKAQGQDPKGTFVNKLICLPGSPVAEDMVAEAIIARDKPYGLHRLGIAMHVYADTWAHQGFAGVIHKANEADSLDSSDKGLLGHVGNWLAGAVIGDVYPLGHGSVLSFPDRPYLKWSYKNHKGKLVQRDNALTFIEAADAMHTAMGRFIAGDPAADVPAMAAQDRAKLLALFKGIKDEDGHDRHQKWIESIGNGAFSFGPAKVTYIAKGADSWKHKALGTKDWTDNEDETFDYKPAFLTSDWKLFHDALLSHRYTVIHEILPRYGICVA